MGLGCFRLGGRGFQGASVAVDPEGSVTPWLVYFWLIKVFFGFQRCHRVLRRWFDLSILSTSPSRWETVGGYFKALGWEGDYRRRLGDVLFRYGRATRSFFFGTPSRERRSRFLAGSSA